MRPNLNVVLLSCVYFIPHLIFHYSY